MTGYYGAIFIQFGRFQGEKRRYSGRITTFLGHNKGWGCLYVEQDAQNDRPARPQRAKARGVPLGYVEGLSDARTPLAGFFSILR